MNTTHTTAIRREVRKGMRAPEFRITCNCGRWQDKAQTEREAERLARWHQAWPHLHNH